MRNDAEEISGALPPAPTHGPVRSRSSGATPRQHSSSFVPKADIKFELDQLRGEKIDWQQKMRTAGNDAAMYRQMAEESDRKVIHLEDLTQQ